MSRWRQYAAVAGLMLVALSAGGCGEDDPEPIFAPTPSVSPTSVPSSDQETSPSVIEPVVEETAEEFIRRWARSSNEMLTSGDSTEYRLLTPECVACRKTADQVDAIYAAGGYIETEGISVTAIRRLPSSAGHVFRVSVRSAPTQYKETSDGPLKTFPGGFDDYQMTLQRVPDWVIADYQVYAK